MQTRSWHTACTSDEATPISAAAKQSPSWLIGFSCVALTSLGWGLNWPATKFILAVCPPLSARGVAGVIASFILFGLAAWQGETLAVPRRLWARLTISALLNVTAWMGLTTASLLWLPAGQAATLAYTMPVWTALLAWPILGDRPTSRQTVAIALGFCGILLLVSNARFELDTTKGPGVVLALSAAILFALGTVRSKQAPIPLPRVTSTAWQVALGCIPLLVSGLLYEDVHLGELPLIGWGALAYTALVSMGMCYVLWFVAVSRLSASTASIGTLLTPIIGVVASSLVLGEPLIASQAAALSLVVTGIVLSIKKGIE